MGRINKSEIFDIKDVQQGANEIIADFERIAKSAVENGKKIKSGEGFKDLFGATGETKKLITDFNTTVKTLKTTIDSITSSITKNTTAKKANSSANDIHRRRITSEEALKKELIKTDNKLAASEAQLTESHKQVKKAELEKTLEVKKAVAAIKEEITGEQAAKQVIKDHSEALAINNKLKADAAAKSKKMANAEAVANAEAKKLIGTFAGLKKSLQDNIVKYQNLVLKKKQNTVEGKKLAAQIRAEQTAIDRVNKTMGTGVKRTGGLASSFKKLTLSLRNLAVAYLGFQTLMRGFQDIFKVTKILDSVTFAQEKVIKSQVEFAQTQDWLSEIISDYGLDLITVTNRYTKFRAATISSNLSALETQKIFGSMSKAAATLGLKTDELQGVYLALEQMISKNKVTTEELRRQLGERLPGAFDIMAKSMGVSTNKLNDMLKAGKVMSEDVLPKFADAVEEAYGIKSVRFVDTLVGAQNRLRTQWIELIKIFNAGDSLKGFLNTMASAVKWIGDNINLIVRLTKIVVGLSAVMLIHLGIRKLLNSEYVKSIKLFVVSIASTIKQTAAFVSQTISVIASGIALRGLTVAQRALSIATGIATAATNAFKWALTSTGVGALIVGLGTLIAVIAPLISKTKSVTKSTSDFNDKLTEEKNKIDLLFSTLRDATTGTEEWNRAKQQINSTYGKYLQNLVDEKTTLEEIYEIEKLVNQQSQGRMLLMNRDIIVQKATKENNEKVAESYNNLSDILKNVEKNENDVVLSSTKIGLLQSRLSDTANELADGTISSGDAIRKMFEDTDGSLENISISQQHAVVSLLESMANVSNKTKKIIKDAKEEYISAATELEFLIPKEQFEEFKKGIKSTERAFSVFSKVVGEKGRESFKDELERRGVDFDTYKQFLEAKLIEVGKFTDKSRFIEGEIEKLKFTDWKKTIEDRGDELTRYTKFSSKQAKIEWIGNNEQWAEGTRTYKEYLEQRLKDLSLNITQRQILEELLFDIDKKGKDPKNNELKLQESRDKIALKNKAITFEAERALLSEKLTADSASEKERYQKLSAFDLENKQELLSLEINLAKNRKDLAVEVSDWLIASGVDEVKTKAKLAEEILKINEQVANAELKIAQNTADRKEDIADTSQDKIERTAEESQAFEQNRTNETILGLEKRFADESAMLLQSIKDKEISEEQYRERIRLAEKELQDDLIRIQISGLKRQLAIQNLRPEEYNRINEQVLKLQGSLSESEVEETDLTANKIIDRRKELRGKKIEFVNEAFNFGNTIFDRQLANAEALKNREVALAGNSIEARLIAERKFERESLKIKKRQAIADKAQAVFNVITNTAVGITSALTSVPPNVPLSIVIGGIGLLQLGKILATPIPAFSDGVEGFSGGLAVVGDKKGDSKLTKKGGSELITLPSGDSFLSPDSPTLMDLPSGTHIDSHSETQRILANAASKTAYERIDMGRSEKYLKDIRDKESINYVDGYKIIKRKGFYGKYKVN